MSNSVRIYVIPKHGVVLRVSSLDEDLYNGRLTRRQAMAMLIELASAIQRDDETHDLFEVVQ